MALDKTERIIKEISDRCVECGLCRKHCAFLQEYGLPKELADSYNPETASHDRKAFECSLCSLCAAVCPVHLSPSSMFLQMRRDHVARTSRAYAEHATVLRYEKIGTSGVFSWYGLPEGCDTVLFPGCTLAGTRPNRVVEIFQLLRKHEPSVGVVLNCCTKPSHDLGRQDHFQTIFGGMRGYLLDRGVRTVISACPSCHVVFKEYGRGLSAKTIYEVLSETGLPASGSINATVTVHDPCSIRFETKVHSAVRELIRAKGAMVEEMESSGTEALCCGEGGSAAFVAPRLAAAWGTRRKSEAHDRTVLAYCAGCTSALSRTIPVIHLLDFIFEPQAAISGNLKISRSPMTYWNRLMVKRRLRAIMDKEIPRKTE